MRAFLNAKYFYFGILILSGCKFSDDKTEIQYVQNPTVPIESNSGLKTNYRIHDYIYLEDYFSSKAKPLRFEVISGKADIKNSILYFTTEGTIVLRVTNAEKTDKTAVFVVTKSLNIRGLETDSRPIWSTSLNLGSTANIMVEGGTPPYKYNLKNLESGELKSHVDETGKIWVYARASENFQILVEDSLGQADTIRSVRTANLNGSDWTQDETWANQGSFKIPNQANQIMRLSSDNKNVYVAGIQLDKENTGSLVGIKKLKITDGTLEEKFGTNGQVEIKSSNVDTRLLHLEPQSDGGFVVLVQQEEKPLWGSKDESLFQHLIMRYDSDGRLNVKFGIRKISEIFEKENSKEFGFKFSLSTDDQDRIYVGLELVNKTAKRYQPEIFRLNSDGTIDKTFGKSGILKLNERFNFVKMDVRNSKIVVLGTYSADGDHESELSLSSFDLSGRPTLNFGIDNLAVTDFKHKPANARLPYVYPTDVFISVDGRIMVAGSDWDDPFFAVFDSEGKLSNVKHIKANADLGFFRGFEIQKIDNDYVVFSKDHLKPETDSPPIWRLKQEDKLNYLSLVEVEFDILKGKDFSIQDGAFYYGKHPWFQYSTIQMLQLPDGSLLINTNSGIVRVIN